MQIVFEIVQLLTVPGSGGQVAEVRWVAKAEEGEGVDPWARWIGCTALPGADVGDGAGTVPFADLTLEQVRSWVEANLSDAERAAMAGRFQARAQEQELLETPPLPWQQQC